MLGLAAALVAAGVYVVVRRGDANPPLASPSAAPSVTAGSSGVARPDCAPRITADYLDLSNTISNYAFVYVSRCDEVVAGLSFRVTALDATGAAVGEVEQDYPRGGVLFPGAELATAGKLDVPAGAHVAKIAVAVYRYGTASLEDYSAWARAKVVDLAADTPDRLGAYTVTGKVQGDPAGVPLCISEFVLIKRNAKGVVVEAQTDPAPVGTSVPAPQFYLHGHGGDDLPRTTVYAAQSPRTGEQQRPGVPCTGA